MEWEPWVILRKSAICWAVLEEVHSKAHPVPSRSPSGRRSRSDKGWRGGRSKRSPCWNWSCCGVLPCGQLSSHFGICQVWTATRKTEEGCGGFHGFLGLPCRLAWPWVFWYLWYCFSLDTHSGNFSWSLSLPFSQCGQNYNNNRHPWTLTLPH